MGASPIVVGVCRGGCLRDGIPGPVSPIVIDVRIRGRPILPVDAIDRIIAGIKRRVGRRI